MYPISKMTLYLRRRSDGHIYKWVRYQIHDLKIPEVLVFEELPFCA